MASPLQRGFDWPAISTRATVADVPVSYRPELDGLRAIAVLLVIGYHVAPAALPGGFIGVDVFFVLSGYLITGLIVRQLTAGRFSLAHFYVRRIRRIFPALLAVLVASTTVGWLVLLPSEWRWFGRSLGWSAPMLANMFFAHTGGYFAAASHSNPLLHLWSLGVEEQFYLLWPLLLLAAVRERLLLPVICAAVAASFAVSLWGAWHAPLEHFFQPAARLWELGTGGLAACWTRRTAGSSGREGLQRRKRQPAFASEGLVLLGLGILGAAAIGLDSTRAFPTPWIVITVAATALVLCTSEHNWIAARLLARPVPVAIGRASYSLYLWHWPLLVFARLLLGGTAPTAAAASLIIIAAGALSALSLHTVEEPLRRGRGSGPVAALLIGLGVMTLLGFAASRGSLAPRLRGAAIAALDLAMTDWHPPPMEHWKELPADAEIFALGARRAHTTLLIGDSHMQQYWPRVAARVARDPHANAALFMTFSGCPFLPGLNGMVHPRDCTGLLDAAIRHALQPDVDRVVIAAFWEKYLLGEYPDRPTYAVYAVDDPLRRPVGLSSPAVTVAFERLAALLARLTAEGRQVFLVLSNPTSPAFEPVWQIAPIRRSFEARAQFLLRPAAVDARPFESFVEPLTVRLRALAASTGVQLLDPRTTVCDGLRCPFVGLDGEPLYIDSNHLRTGRACALSAFIDPVVDAPGEAPGVEAPLMEAPGAATRAADGGCARQRLSDGPGPS